MSLPELYFTSQVSQLIFDGPGDLLSTARESAKQRQDEHLNVNFTKSTESSLELQSRTASTLVSIQPSVARMSTQYFDDFRHAAKIEERTRYAMEKHGSLFSLLQSVGARFSFLGIVVTARMEAPLDEEPQRLARLASRALGLSTELTESSDIYDFDVRVSRIIEPDMYSNIYVKIFQERRITLDASQLANLHGKSIHDWEFPLSAHGIEFKYDRNNKRGLYAGGPGWSTERYLELVEGALKDAPAVFERLMKVMQSKEAG